MKNCRRGRLPALGLLAFSLLRGQVARFDGGYTRFILMDGWGLGAMGYRTAIPFRQVPGLEYWDCNGPTLSLNLVFGVF